MNSRKFSLISGVISPHLPQPSIPMALLLAVFIFLCVAVLKPLTASVAILGFLVLIASFSSPLVVLGILFFTVFISPFLLEYGYIPAIRGLHPTNGVIALTALVVVVRRLAVEKSLIWKPSTLHLPFALFFGMLILDALFSERILDPANAALSRGFTYRSLINIFIFFIVSQAILSRHYVRVLFRVLLAVFVSVSLIAVIQHLQMSNLLGSNFAIKGRSTGIFHEPGLLSNFSMTGALVAWSLFLFRKGQKWRGIYFLTTLLCSLAVLFSYMRATYMGLAAGLCFICWKKDRRWLWLVALALLTLPLWAPESVMNRLIYTFGSYGDVKALDESSSVRFMLWPAALQAICAHPWTGNGHYSFVLQLSTELVPQAGQPYNAHQLFLNNAVDFGAIGLAVFLFFGLSLLWEGWRLFNLAAARAYPLESALGLALTATIVGLVFSYSTHALLFDSPMIPYIFGLAALVGRARQIILKEGASPPPANTGP